MFWECENEADLHEPVVISAGRWGNIHGHDSCIEIVIKLDNKKNKNSFLSRKNKNSFFFFLRNKIKIVGTTKGRKGKIK